MFLLILFSIGLHLEIYSQLVHRLCRKISRSSAVGTRMRNFIAKEEVEKKTLIYCLMNLQLRKFGEFWVHVKCCKCVWCPTHRCDTAISPSRCLVWLMCCCSRWALCAAQTPLCWALELCWSLCRSSGVGNRYILVGEFFVSNTWVFSQLHSKWAPVEFTRSEEAEPEMPRCG